MIGVWAASLVGLAAGLGVLTITGQPRWWGIGGSASIPLRWGLAASAAFLGGAETAAGHDWLVLALVASLLAAGADLVARCIPHRWLAVMAGSGLLALAGQPSAWEPTAVMLSVVAVVFTVLVVATHGGLGWGDAKLATALAVVAGWPGALLALPVGLVLAGVWVLGRRVVDPSRSVGAIPLAPFLVLGVVLLAGELR